jgi:hypothetical protein
MTIVIYIFIFISAFILQELFHELGHLIGGLASGYHFLSFHWGLLSFDISAKRKFCLDRTYYGQCVMIPNNDNNKHYVLYNISGILSNFILSLIASLLLLTLFDIKRVIFIFLLCLVISGIIKILGNTLPLTKKKPNDIQIIRWLLKSQQMVVDYFIYLRVYEKYSYGFDKMHSEDLYSISNLSFSDEDNDMYIPFFRNECLKLFD